MKLVFTQIFTLLSLMSFGQEFTTITVLVPNKTDEVYVVGNQEVLGNWQPDEVKI